MRHIRNTMHFSLCAILIAVATVCGYHGIGHGKEIRQESKYTPEIDSLLREHDKCVRGESLSDSAIVYTISALQLADSVYGIESKEYAEIFTDYMIADMSPNKNITVDRIYPLVMLMNPETEGIWRTYYKLGVIMEQFQEDEKAKQLFYMASKCAVQKADQLRAEIWLRIEDFWISADNLEESLRPLLEDVRTLESHEKEDLLFLCTRYLVKYYIDTNQNDRAMQYIKEGEKLSECVSAYDMLLLLRDKYDLLVENDYIASMETLDQAIQYVSMLDTPFRDKDINWIALALIKRSDHALNTQMNGYEAYKCILKASHFVCDYMSIHNPLFQIIARKLINLSSLCEDDESAVKLCRLLIDKSSENGVTVSTLHNILELINLYIKTGNTEEVSELISKYHNELYSNALAKELTTLYECELELLKGNYNDAAIELEKLLKSNPSKSTSSRALLDIAKTYSLLGDHRMADASDSSKHTMKNNVATHLLLLTPNERWNWLNYCDDAIELQLSLPNNPQAVRNAAELNLFKKSLLFRTSKQIENIVSAIPGASDDISRLHSLQRECEAASSKGDSVNYQTLFREKDRLEQQIVSRYVENDKFLDLIDVKIDDVISKLPADCAAIDFISKKTHGKTETGAFVYSKDMAIRYVPILNYMDSLPSNATESIWEKLTPLVGKYSALYFSADGPINDMAIEYAQLPDGTNISNKIKLHRLFHLSEIKATDNTLGHVAFVGVSDHNSPVETGQNVTRGNWTDLENVELELNSLKNRISPQSLTVLYNNDATEKQFMALDGSDITALHITTHGVYRNVGSMEESARTPSSDDYHVARRLIKIGKESLSALILREGNLNWHKDAITSDYDDLLTSEEIELMNFPNLQLTVLSACDTGLGEVDSEGVWGLQRAFRIAGTKSLICSLSKVDDYWTAQFMDAFYEQAAKGNTVYDSFHTAQRWLRHELPDNPEIWSSFILIE